MTTWIKLHDNFWEHPKVLAAGEDAALLYVQGLSYCSRNLTDGKIPAAALRNLTAKRNATTLARVLVREGLWAETAQGWEVHDYTKVQRSRAQVEASREAARERQRRSRSVTAPSRRDSQRSSGEVTPSVTTPETDTDTETPPPTPTPPPLLENPPSTLLPEEQVHANLQGIASVRSELGLPRKVSA